jgi:hypothetical protein
MFTNTNMEIRKVSKLQVWQGSMYVTNYMEKSPSQEADGHFYGTWTFITHH